MSEPIARGFSSSDAFDQSLIMQRRQNAMQGARRESGDVADGLGRAPTLGIGDLRIGQQIEDARSRSMLLMLVSCLDGGSIIPDQSESSQISPNHPESSRIIPDHPIPDQLTVSPEQPSIAIASDSRRYHPGRPAIGRNSVLCSITPS